MALINLATTPNGSLAAFAKSDLRPANAKKEEEHILRVFDLAGGRCLVEFPVLWDGGGRRIAFSQDGKTIYVGCYDVHGVACYSVGTGKELWRRRDLKAIQVINSSTTQDRIFCERSTGAAALLNGTTGETLPSPRGVKGVWFSAFEDFTLVERGKNAELEIHQPLGRKIGNFPRESFAVLNAALSGNLLLFAEPKTPLRAIDLKSASEIWRFPAEDAHKCHALAYSPRRKAFVACHSRNGGFGLLTISPDDGHSVCSGTVERWSGAFFGDGEFFVDCQGSTYSVETGQMLLHRLFEARSSQTTL